ncbi:MAG: 6-phosphogluconolactonase [Candidatus Sedimenticola sp. (ex Thyasira tokunagai)]
MLHWTILENSEAIAHAAAERISQIAQQAIAERGRFSLVLAGGGTPAAAYARLATIKADWQRWHIYFGDERCLPIDHPERNSRMAAETLLSKVPIPADQIHPIPAELGAERGAELYGKTIHSALPFDLVLLGIGEDGHTASLFPDHGESAATAVIAVHQAPKPPADRISLSSETLSNCRQLIYLVSGGGKQSAVRRWIEGEPLPVSRIHAQEESEVLIDQDAMPANTP